MSGDAAQPEVLVQDHDPEDGHRDAAHHHEPRARIGAVPIRRSGVGAAGIDPADIGAVIVSTVTYFHQTPSLAAKLAYELGTNGAAFDISAACAGFCYGLAQAESLVRSGAAKYAVVIGVEELSRFTDIHDRSTAFLFALGTMRPESGVPPWTMRLAMKGVFGGSAGRKTDCHCAGSRRRQRISSMAASSSGDSVVSQASRHSSSCAIDVTPISVLATRQLR